MLQWGLLAQIRFSGEFSSLETVVVKVMGEWESFVWWHFNIRGLSDFWSSEEQKSHFRPYMIIWVKYMEKKKKKNKQDSSQELTGDMWGFIHLCDHNYIVS